MSKLKVSGNASGTGVITLEAPNTNTDRTITLPDGDISLGVGIDDNATSTAITIDASENVGIGTTSPDAPLHVVGDLNYVNALNANGTITLSSDDYGNAGFDASPSIVFEAPYSSNTANTVRVPYAIIEGRKESASGGNTAGFLSFSTSEGGSAGTTERLRITSDGRGLSQFTAKAWVCFNNVGTTAILDSHNCSSVTDRGVGVTSVTMTNACASVNYATGASTVGNTTAWGGTTFVAGDNAYAKTTTEFTISIRKQDGSSYGTNVDVNNVSAIVFGD
jgi:hypothetical protein